MNMQAMLKQAQAMQKDMLKIKEEIDNTEFVGESSLVSVVLKGTKELVSVKINADSLDSDDVEALQDMIVVAVNQANKKIDDMMEKKMIMTTSMSSMELIGLVTGISSYKVGDQTGFPFDQVPANLADAGDCVVPVNLTANVSQLHNFLYGDPAYVPSETVQGISAEITARTGIA